MSEPWLDETPTDNVPCKVQLFCIASAPFLERKSRISPPLIIKQKFNCCVSELWNCEPFNCRVVMIVTQLCLIYSVQCTLYKYFNVVSRIDFEYYTVHFFVDVQCTLCTIYVVQCTLFTLYTVHFLRCTLYTFYVVHCTALYLI